MKIFLETPRLNLRQFTIEDRPLIAELDSDPAVMRFISNGIPSDEAEVDRAIGVFLESRKLYQDQLGYFAAHLKDSQEFIGWFHLRPLKSAPQDLTKLELGYRLKKSCWGLGLASEGSKALIERGLQRPEVTQILAHTMKGNSGSIRVMEKLGMSFLSEDIYEEWPGDDKVCVWYQLQK